jgi:hypothetical protein
MRFIILLLGSHHLSLTYKPWLLGTLARRKKDPDALVYRSGHPRGLAVCGGCLDIPGGLLWDITDAVAISLLDRYGIEANRCLHCNGIIANRLRSNGLRIIEIIDIIYNSFDSLLDGGSRLDLRLYVAGDMQVHGADVDCRNSQ